MNVFPALLIDELCFMLSKFEAFFEKTLPIYNLFVTFE